MLKINKKDNISIKYIGNTEGFDGHSLRAYTYFKNKMNDITQEIINFPEKKVEIINSIKEKYKSLRQAAKAPTFALT